MSEKIHLTDKPPVACASCGGQYTDRRHVDFGAAYDGPTFPAEDVAGGTVVTVDDLIVCEQCVRDAGRVLGLVDPDAQTRQLEQQASQLQTLSERLAGALAYVNRLEAAAKERESLEEILKPKRARKS
jgi:hypothetical protein